jgi:hypothetical protein
MPFSLALLSGSLLCLPIIVTGGIYTGVESQKIIDLTHGKIPPQSSPGAPKIGSTGTYCQQSYGITPYPGRYICKSSPLPLSSTSILLLHLCVSGGFLTSAASVCSSHQASRRRPWTVWAPLLPWLGMRRLAISLATANHGRLATRFLAWLHDRCRNLGHCSEALVAGLVYGPKHLPKRRPSPLALLAGQPARDGLLCFFRFFDFR